MDLKLSDIPAMPTHKAQSPTLNDKNWLNTESNDGIWYENIPAGRTAADWRESVLKDDTASCQGINVRSLADGVIVHAKLKTTIISYMTHVTQKLDTYSSFVND